MVSFGFTRDGNLIACIKAATVTNRLIECPELALNKLSDSWTYHLSNLRGRTKGKMMELFDLLKSIARNGLSSAG